MELQEHQIKSYLQRISNILLINGGFSGNPGLYTGDMGLVLFFSCYARYTQNDLYSEYSHDLIGKMQKRINEKTPIDYSLGLTGIGSAFEYLVQNSFFNVETDDILKEFDEKIFSMDTFWFGSHRDDDARITYCSNGNIWTLRSS